MIHDLLNWWTAHVSLHREVYHNPIRQWLVAIAVFVAAVVILRVVKSLLVRRASLVAERSPSPWVSGLVDLVRATKLWFLLVLSAYLASLFLDLPPRTLQIVRSVTVVTLLLQAAIWGNALILFATADYTRRRMEIDAAGVTTISALSFVGRLALWSVVVLLALSNMGVDVTALVAGLGIGGLAVALAAQNILGDLFASLSIVLDKPFVLGDFIVVGDHLGTVEYIGLKTTRLRSLSGEQLIFSNNDLLQSRIRNFKRMQQRRILFTIGVTYQTPHEKLAGIPAIIRETVESHEQTRFDRAHFKEYGESALVFEVVYFVLTADFAVYMDIQQAINMDLYRRFEEQGIEFAYPTQTLYVEKRQG